MSGVSNTDDLDYIQRLLATGVYIGMNRYGIDLCLSTDPPQSPTGA